MNALSFLNLQILMIFFQTFLTTFIFLMSWYKSSFTIVRNAMQHKSLFSFSIENVFWMNFHKRVHLKTFFIFRFYLKYFEKLLILTITRKEIKTKMKSMKKMFSISNWITNSFDIIILKIWKKFVRLNERNQKSLMN